MAILFRGSASSWRTLGSAATPHNLLTIENGNGSGRIVNVIGLRLQMDATAVLTSVTPQIKISRIAVPSGGTPLAKVAWNPSLANTSSLVVVRGATASDGGSATPITATAADTIWQGYLMRLHTAVGQVLMLDVDLMPNPNYPIVLAANSGLLVQLVATAGTSNPNTNHYIVNIAWEEDG